MQKRQLYELLKENLCVQDEALKKLIWVLDNNFYSNLNFKNNILLIGGRGSGKTTMVKETADLMELPFGEVYNMFTPQGINYELFVVGLSQMMRDSVCGEGIILLHDFQNEFLYDNGTFNAKIASGTLNFENETYFDVSNITFIGEIDTNCMEDIFPEQIDYLADLEENRFMSPTLQLLYEHLTDDNVIFTDDDHHQHASLRLEKYFANQVRSRFLSSTCEAAFQTKIFMEDMNRMQLLKALRSPISAVNLYRGDLTQEYIESDVFLTKIVNQIMESNKGLHSVSEAIENTISHDCRQNQKILKKDSIFRTRKQ